jgi:hypothetical protein
MLPSEFEYEFKQTFVVRAFFMTLAALQCHETGVRREASHCLQYFSWQEKQLKQQLSSAAANASWQY